MLNRWPLDEVSQDLREPASVAVRGWGASDDGVGGVVGQRIGVDREPGGAAIPSQQPRERMVGERGSKRRDWAQAFAIDRQIGVPEGEPHHATVGADVMRVYSSEQRFAVCYFVRQARLVRRRRGVRQRGSALPVALYPR